MELKNPGTDNISLSMSSLSALFALFTLFALNYSGSTLDNWTSLPEGRWNAFKPNSGNTERMCSTSLAWKSSNSDQFGGI